MLKQYIGRLDQEKLKQQLKNVATFPTNYINYTHFKMMYEAVKDKNDSDFKVVRNKMRELDFLYK